MKYYLGTLGTASGEYSFTTHIRFKTDKDPGAYLDDIARHWYEFDEADKEDHPDSDGGGYYHNCGCVFVKAEGFQEISKKVYDIIDSISEL